MREVHYPFYLLMNYIPSEFSGKSKIEQHKMVYNSLKGKMGNELHALAIKTKEN